MFSKRKFELSLIAVFLLFSTWLMYKSFGYTGDGNFYIARHQVGDFGLHLSLIRSFSWGDNVPPESPFFPGIPLPYHYYFDFFVGMLEKLGTRIDIAFNGVSILFFAILLLLIYKIPQRIFGEQKVIGILSVLLFVLHSNLTFFTFLAKYPLDKSIFSTLWTLPDYLHKGPFDGSVISLFFTLNVFLNQRHLIAGLAVSLFIIYILLPKFVTPQKTASVQLILISLILGLSSRVHTLSFFATCVILFLLCLLFKRYRFIPFLFLPALSLFSFYAKDILLQPAAHSFIHLGFLSQQPLTIENFFIFWGANLGIALILIPLGFLLANKNQKKIFLAFLPIFIIGNIFQFSFRIDHNHSLFNFFIILANFYVAFLLVKLWTKKVFARITVVIIFFLLTASGFINLMPIKNDFRYPVALDFQDPFISWVKNKTNKDAIFLAREEILDPITMAGRRNYMGHKYYLTVMGYDFRQREKLVKKFFEAKNSYLFDTMRKENISFIVLPKKQIADFTYTVDQTFFQKHLEMSYEDEERIVFAL